MAWTEGAAAGTFLGPKILHEKLRATFSAYRWLVAVPHQGFVSRSMKSSVHMFKVGWPDGCGESVLPEK